MTGGAAQSRIAIVTGGGRGIGAAVARALARERMSVLVVSRTEEQLVGVCDSIRGAGGTAHYCVADVSSPDQGRRVVLECEQVFGVADVLVNCAGVQGAIGPFAEVDMIDWWRVVEINLRGTAEMCAAVLPGMIRRGGGTIINFSGGGATAPMPRFTAYAASKAAVVRFTETLATEVLNSGVTVNAIAPGVVDTDIQDAVLAAGDRAGAEYDRMRRLRESGEGAMPPELAADLAAHLAAGRAGRLTGKLISAPHDAWRDWDAGQLSHLGSTPWLTLRRLDRHTVEPLLADRQALP